MVRNSKERECNLWIPSYIGKKDDTRRSIRFLNHSWDEINFNPRSGVTVSLLKRFLLRVNKQD